MVIDIVINQIATSVCTFRNRYGHVPSVILVSDELQFLGLKEFNMIPIVHSSRVRDVEAY